MTTCRLCHASPCEHVSTVEKIWPGSWPVHFCKTCEYYFLDPLPDEHLIREYYENEYWNHSLLRDIAKGVFRHFRVSSQCAYLSRLLELDNISGTIVELGAADGEFIGQLKVPGKKIALEASDYYAQSALKKFGILLDKRDILAFNEPADLFLMSHVIEHFNDPMKVMSHCYSILKPGGYMYIEVPNSPKPEDVPQFELDDYLCTEHIVNFRYPSLKTLAEDTGLRVLDISRYASRLPTAITEDRRRHVTAAIMGATKPQINDLPVIALHIGSGLINPEKSYASFSTETPYLGIGDNLRMLAQKPVS